MTESARVDRVLEPAGLTDDEEPTYRALLVHPSGSTDELAAAAGISAECAAAALDRLVEAGLVSRSPGEEDRFAPAPPEVALEAIIQGRQEALDRARWAIRELQATYRRTREQATPSDLVEVVAGRRAVAERVTQLQLMCTKELLDLSKPPYAVAPGGQEALAPALRRGIRYQAVYDRTALEYPGVLEEAIALGEAGASQRVHPQVPIKLLIVDRRMALLPLSLRAPDLVEGALFLRGSSLLEALVLLWETTWDRGLPLHPATDADVDPEARLSDEDRRLVGFLLAGLKVPSIARRLEMSVSSVERRIKRLMSDVGAETRFQAGFLIADRLRGDGRTPPDGSQEA